MQLLENKCFGAGICPGGICLGGMCLGGMSPRGNVSEVVYVPGGVSRGVYV